MSNGRNLVLKYKDQLVLLRKETGARITDEALVTYIAKNDGDVEKAYQNYCRGPWASLIAGNPLPVQNGKCERSGVADSLKTLGELPTQLSTTHQSSHKFSSKALSAGTHAIGSTVVDLTSSCRIFNYSSEEYNEASCSLMVFFFVVPPKSVSRKGKQHSASKHLSDFNTSVTSGGVIEITKDNLANQVFLRDRYLGTLPSGIASTLGVLVFLDFIRITLQLVDHIDSSVRIGSPIPVLLHVYITPTALSTEISTSHPLHSLLPECWSHLLFTILDLTPARPSMLWSSGPIGLSRLKTLPHESNISAPKTPKKTDLLSSRALSPDDRLDEESTHLTEDDESTDTTGDCYEEEDSLLECAEEAIAKTNQILPPLIEQDIRVESPSTLPLHPAIFRSTLRPYQLQGVQWMREHEGAESCSLLMDSESTMCDQQTSNKYMLHPMWDELVIPKGSAQHEGMTFYCSRSTGTVTTRFPANIPQSLGGILADEMGLGKTVQTIALLACELFPTEDEQRAYRMCWESESGIPDETSAEFLSFIVFRRQQRSAIKRHVQLAQQFTVESPSGQCSGTTPQDVTGIQTQLFGGTLLIVPLSLMTQWKREIHTHLTSGVASILEFYGRGRPKDPLTLTTADIVLTTYGMIAHEFKRLGHKKTLVTTAASNNQGKLVTLDYVLSHQSAVKDGHLLV